MASLEYKNSPNFQMNPLIPKSFELKGGKMIKKAVMTAALVAAVLVFAQPACSADVVYVQSLKVRIMSAPSFSADTKGHALKGEPLTVLDRAGRWYKVGYGDKTGWVPRLVVGPKPPMKRVTVFTGEEKSISKEARRRASQVTSAAAARGLAEDDRRRLGHESAVDYRSLEKLNAIVITEQELSEFIKEGLK